MCTRGRSVLYGENRMEPIWHPNAYANLRKDDSRLAEVYRMKADVGCSESEIAAALGIPQRLIRRDLAKIYLLLQGFEPPPENGTADIVSSPLPPRPPLSSQQE